MEYWPHPEQELKKAIKTESLRFEETYKWLQKHMPKSFFREITPESLRLIAHNLMNLAIHGYFNIITLKNGAIILCLDGPQADLTILKNFSNHGIRYFKTFVSNQPPPFSSVKEHLKIGFVDFAEEMGHKEDLPAERVQELGQLIKERNPQITTEEFEKLLKGMNKRFLLSMTTERLILAFDLFFRAKESDQCQYEIREVDNWKEKGAPSLQIVFAWRNTPKHKFLYRVLKTIDRHGLDLKRVAATYIDPYSKESILIMSLGIDGKKGRSASEEANLDEFLRELLTLKYFPHEDLIDKVFVDSSLLNNNMANFIRSASSFVYQVLVQLDPHLYTSANVEEGLTRHTELTIKLCQAFEAKFHPKHHNVETYEQTQRELLKAIQELDTGKPSLDLRRKQILTQASHFIEYTLKTNFYRINKSSLSFRLDPNYLDLLPFKRQEKFPELPFAIFFVKGMNFIGFHVRFKDLSRGGLRTVVPRESEQWLIEQETVFNECYNLAYTQQKKNKDIPEGGAKGIILLEPFELVPQDAAILERELIASRVDEETLQKQLKEYREEQKLAFLYHSQRSFIHSLVTLVNCEDDGRLKLENIVDYWRKPEYIYLGPDENMHNSMIEWIADYSLKVGYKPKRSFISSKPSAGINHKTYGVTSLGVTVCMEELLQFLGIDPTKQTFTVKISGGPDGDVAGNAILNLYRFYPNTARLVAITDISGTIFDPEGLDLSALVQLFKETKPIRFYPVEKLHEKGFLLDLQTKQESRSYVQQTLLWKRDKGQLSEVWLSGNETQHLFRYNLHQTKADVFIPGGGRPKTLNIHNWTDFLDETGHPTSRAIAEGANLYLTEEARHKLEEMGTLIIKDSSCNKGGVITSSYEVLSGLVLSEEEFLEAKDRLVEEILGIIRHLARSEAKVLLSTYKQQSGYLTELSDHLSSKINTFKYAILQYLEHQVLSNSFDDPLIRCLLCHCPPLLRKEYKNSILKIPDIHKKAIIAAFIGSHLVYTKGLDWEPTNLIASLPSLAGKLADIFEKGSQ